MNTITHISHVLSRTKDEKKERRTDGETKDDRRSVRDCEPPGIRSKRKSQESGQCNYKHVSEKREHPEKHTTRGENQMVAAVQIH
jgi:hypothetical protein